MNFSLALLLLCSSIGAAKAGTWRPDLPWDKLASSIAGDLIDTAPSNYLEECKPEFEKAVQPNFSRSNHGLINQPSGICLPHFFCAFDNCAPTDPEQQEQSTVAEVISYTGSFISIIIPALATLYSELDPTMKGWVEDDSNPSYDLPSKVLFPKEAKDVVAAVKFAKEHKLEVSLKNSGHSYTKASSKGGTLHINMNKYYHYATNDGVTDCNASNISDDLSDQPCRLSIAKGKDAVLRVGGGENWNKVYSAVRKANEEQEGGFKYHAVGGAAATVSPMGWTFSAGLSGNSAGRVMGFGVDQVLHIEMVLPNGAHVKFGPTEWETAEGFDVPKTLSVTGLCNSNPEDAEVDWVWEECSEDLAVNFDDLWFAVRGGGGGTWGVVLSMYLQLHEYQPLERIFHKSLGCVDNKLDDTLKAGLNYVYQTFEIKYVLDPSSINVTESESNACGWPASDTQFSCYGEGSALVFDNAWKTYLDNSRNGLVDYGIGSEIIDEAISCETKVYKYSELTAEAIAEGIAHPGSVVTQYKDWLENIVLLDGPYAGKGSDSPQPGFGVTMNDMANILLPRKWILENIDSAVTLLPPNPLSYRAFGGKAAGAVSDQMDSLSVAHREAGYMHFFVLDPALFEYFPLKYDDEFFTVYFPAMFDTSDKSNFPSFLGANHAGVNTLGPLKSDWTKSCPLEWTKEERDEKCVPLQECIWGTKLLKKLEGIKEAIDPDYMFDCNGCVGNNRLKDKTDTPSPTVVKSPPEQTLSPSPTMDKSPAEQTMSPTASSSAVPISSAMILAHLFGAYFAFLTF